MPMKQTVDVIFSPTASGKSSKALDMAQSGNGVIINADSMQIYDALHVLTAQPSAAEQAQAPHRLYAHLPPDQDCSAQLWRDLAADQIRQALDAGQRPIIVGGTGFYIKALTEGLSPVPAIPADVRIRMTQKQKELGNPGFHSWLAQHDTIMAERLHPNDTQRLIRAMEVWDHTGESLAVWQEKPLSGSPDADWHFEYHYIDMPREELYARCDKRFDMMMDEGIMDEVEALSTMIDDGLVSESAAITNALGFHPLRSYLKGALAKDDAVAQAKQETRHYAKRQLTWLRNQMKSI